MDSSEKKILDKSPVVSGLMVPLAIVLVGALIIFGVTKMLSTDRSYQDLVREMESKSFGNKWVAAYELSKVIASSQIPKEEIPALISRLSDIYSSPSADPRTRDFIVVALGALDSPHSLPLLKKALGDSDKNVKFHAITSIGNMSKENLVLDWGPLLGLLKSSDRAIQQAAVLTLGTHRVLKSEPLIEKLLNSEDVGVYAKTLSERTPFTESACRRVTACLEGANMGFLPACLHTDVMMMIDERPAQRHGDEVPPSAGRPDRPGPVGTTNTVTGPAAPSDLREAINEKVEAFLRATPVEDLHRGEIPGQRQS